MAVIGGSFVRWPMSPKACGPLPARQGPSTLKALVDGPTVLLRASSSRSLPQSQSAYL
jgi:hypothetical protein